MPESGVEGGGESEGDPDLVEDLRDTRRSLRQIDTERGEHVR